MITCTNLNASLRPFSHLLAVTMGFFSAISSMGQPGPIPVGPSKLQVIGKLPPIIKEASGLEITRGKILWTHNDGGLPVLYGLDTMGNLVKTVHLNHTNNGWEDLAINDNDSLFVGNFGNNSNTRKNLRIYKIPNPDSIEEMNYNGEITKFTYPDQKKFPPAPSKKNFDADAMIALQGNVYVFTKNRTQPFDGFTKVYKIPAKPGDYEAELIDSLFLGSGGFMMEHWVTGADLSPDGRTLVLLTHNGMWIIKDFNLEKISSKKIYWTPFNHFSHKAGICFVDNTKLFIVDEVEYGLPGGNLYSTYIPKLPEN